MKASSTGSRIRAIIALGVALALAACAQNQPLADIDPTPNSSNAATLHIYRPWQFFHAGNPEQPFVYVNDKYIGKLGVGGALIRQFPPGDYRLSIRGSILFMPGLEIGSIALAMDAGKTYYARYSYDMTGIIPMPAAPVATGRSSLVLVDEQTARNRR